MARQDPVTIVGPPLDAWLTAAMLARFAPLAGAPLQVLETTPIAGDNEQVILRPEMVRTHVSIGLNPARLVARPVQAWTGPKGQSLPFKGFGQPLKGVSFVSIWLRAREELGEQRPLASFSAADDTRAFAIEAGRYAQALKAIATGVGVTRCEQASGHIVHSDSDVAAANSASLIGAAAISLKPSMTMRLHALHQTVLALIECWPWRDSDRDLAAREYDRRVTAMRSSMSDMQSILWNDGQPNERSSNLRHRIAVWETVGRIAPMDDDPFQPQEWMAAFLHAGFVPRGAGRLAKSLTQAEISAHIQACAFKEVANV